MYSNYAGYIIFTAFGRSFAAPFLAKRAIFACTGLQPRHKPSPPVPWPYRALYMYDNISFINKTPLDKKRKRKNKNKRENSQKRARPENRPFPAI